MRTLSLQRRIVLSVLTGLAAVVFTGCGNLGASNPGARVSKSSVSVKISGVDSLANGGFASDTGYTCPSTINVLPFSDTHGDGSDRYTACPSQSSTTEVSLHGHPFKSTSGALYPQICVFPVQIVNQDSAAPVLNEFGLPLYKCIDTNGPNMRVSFPQSTFNGLVIFNAATTDLNKASLCVKSSQYGQCPPFSSGKIR